MTAEASCLLFKWKVYIFNHFTRVELLAVLESCQASSSYIGKVGLRLSKGNFQVALCRVFVAMFNPAETWPSEGDTPCQWSLLSETTWRPIFSLSFIKMAEDCYSCTQSSTRTPFSQLLPKNADSKKKKKAMLLPPKTAQMAIIWKKICFLLSLYQIHDCCSVTSDLCRLFFYDWTNNSVRQNSSKTLGPFLGLTST